MATLPMTDRAIFAWPVEYDGTPESAQVSLSSFLEDAPEAGVFRFTRDFAREGSPGGVEPRVMLDGAPFPQRFVVHSPTGFEWGYGGSGPAELALNILARFVPAPEAWRLHQRFKWEHIARLARMRDVLGVDTIRAWLADVWATERAVP